MTTAQRALNRPPVEVNYPDSDGQPMSDNTLQFQWIVTLKENLDALLPDFVAGDLLWYPVEGDNKTRIGPDVLVALGRPKGYRGSYQQWREGCAPPDVVFEVLSPNNTFPEMYRKLLFYERHGVAEYYLYDPYTVALSGWTRKGGRLEEIEPIDGWVSPLLGIRFQHGAELEVYTPSGERFLTFSQLKEKADMAMIQAEAAREQAEAAREQAETERARADALAERLRALGFDPDAP